jgi:hypothetical protein
LPSTLRKRLKRIHRPYLDCSDWLADEATVTECVTNRVDAEDHDCKPVETSTSISSSGLNVDKAMSSETTWKVSSLETPKTENC